MNRRLREQLGDEQYITYLESCIKHREEEIIRLDERINKTIKIVLNMAEKRCKDNAEILELLERDNDTKIVKLKF